MPEKCKGMTDEEKREYKRAYMREYKRRKYADNPDAIKECNRRCYYKTKYNGTDEDAGKYGEMFPTVSKITSQLEELRETHPEILRDIIRKYSFEVCVHSIEDIEDLEIV
jgi:hypothetical protein